MIRNLKQRLKDQRGLTLVELLAVIVILGIIAAIAVPSIGGIINKTKEDAQVAEGIQIINAAKLYTSTHQVTNSTTGDLVTKTELAGYLDNLKDDGFTVIIKKGTDGKYEYFLKDHDSVGLVDSGTKDNIATEAELLNY